MSSTTPIAKHTQTHLRSCHLFCVCKFVCVVCECVRVGVFIACGCVHCVCVCELRMRACVFERVQVCERSYTWTHRPPTLSPTHGTPANTHTITNTHHKHTHVSTHHLHHLRLVLCVICCLANRFQKLKWRGLSFVGVVCVCLQVGVWKCV